MIDLLFKHLGEGRRQGRKPINGRGDGWGDGREDGQLSHPPDPHYTW